MTASSLEKVENMETGIWQKSRWVVYVLLLTWGLLLSPGYSGAASKTYADKFGYFSFTPPPGWTQKDYPKDDRARVSFTSPDGKARLSLIVRPAGSAEKTFAQLMASKRDLMEGMRKKKPDGKYLLKEGTICQHKCVQVDVEYPGKLVHESYLFVDQGFHINFGYAATDRKNLEKYRSIAMRSLCTFKLKGRR